MPKPRAKSKPRKKTAAKKNASRAIKLQRGGSFTGPANPRTNVPGHYPMQGRTQGWYPGANPGRPPVNPNRDQMVAQMHALIANERSRMGAGNQTTPPRRPPPSIRPGYQGGGELVDPTPFYPSRIPGGPAGWRPRRPNVPLPPGARRRRGRGRGGRDV